MEGIDISWNEIFEDFNIDLEKLEPYYPEKKDVFKVFSLSVKDIKIVIFGQDPYINKGQANGLAFSVNENTKIPPSLNNIFKELKIEYPERNYEFKNGNLEKWRDNGIFLLNTSLTVQPNKSGSHLKIWEEFINNVIRFIIKNNNKCIFLLLGNNAKQKKHIINNNNRIVECVHPSPLSAYNGFFNSNIFIKLEELLQEKIIWQN